MSASMPSHENVLDRKCATQGCHHPKFENSDFCLVCILQKPFKPLVARRCDNLTCIDGCTDSTRHEPQRGAVLIVVLLTLLVLLGLGMVSLFLTAGSTRVSANLNLSNEARIVAEAGIERARQILLLAQSPVPLPALLTGSGHPSDEIPSNTSKCTGEARGAILVDFSSPSRTPPSRTYPSPPSAGPPTCPHPPVKT